MREQGLCVGWNCKLWTSKGYELAEIKAHAEGRKRWLADSCKEAEVRGTESPWWGRNGWTPALQALEHPWIWTVFHFPNYISISMKLISRSYLWVPWNSRCSLFNVYPYNNSTIIWGNQNKTFHMIKGSQRLRDAMTQDPVKNCQVL